MAEPPVGGREHSPFAGRGFLAAAAVVVVAVALGIALAVGGGGSGPPPGPSQAPAPSPAPTAVAGGPGCAPPGSGQSIPNSAPPGVAWTIYHMVALPSSRTDGPAVVNGDVARCYAHTPVGALIAGAQISVRLVTADHWQAVIAQQVMPGTGRDRLMAAAASATGNGGPSQPGDHGQFAGFKFVAYTPQVAVIEYVSRFSEGSLQMNTLTVAWSGDWRLQLEPSGSPGPIGQPLSSLDGFAIWGGI